MGRKKSWDHRRALASPPSNAERFEQEKRARVATCLEELNELLTRHNCALQIQGQWVQGAGAGQQRVEVMQVGVVSK